MDAVYPASASALGRGRRSRRPEPRVRHRTVPVTFAEIKEADEENEEEGVGSACEERRRRPDLLEERLGRQFAEFRRRRARRDALPERDSPPPPPPPAPRPPPPQPQRAGSEPAALDRTAVADS